MAHIFKYPKNDSKGVLLFTHKEVEYICGYPRRRKGLQRFGLFVPTTIVYKPEKVFAEELLELSKRYFIGVHVGGFYDSFPDPGFIDFCMSGIRQLGLPETIARCPLGSRSFCPEIFEPRPHQEKLFEIICIANSARLKHLKELLQSVRQIYDQGLKYRVLLVVKSNPVEGPVKFYTELEDDYYSMFSREERERIILLRLGSKLSLLGLPKTMVANLLCQSKVLTLFSQQEGSPRVVSEALLCGLAIVVKSDQRGGGRDFLNERNSVLFDTYETAHEALIQAVENYDTMDIDYDELKSQCREDKTIPQLKEWFHQFFKIKGVPFEGDLINCNHLSERLSGHFLEVPWARNRHITADIFTKQQFQKFVQTAAAGGR